MAGFPHPALDSYLGQDRPGGPACRGLRAGRGFPVRQGAGEARGGPGGHARDPDRRRAARPEDGQLPGGRRGGRRQAGPGLGRAVDGAILADGPDADRAGRRDRPAQPGGGADLRAEPGSPVGEDAPGPAGGGRSRSALPGTSSRSRRARRSSSSSGRPRSAGFGVDDRSIEVQAAGALAAYLRETQKTSLGHITRLIPYRRADTLALDEMTRRSLELVRTLREGKREGSLLGVIDCTATPMGARLLSEWLTSPLTSPEAIAERLDAVEELLTQSILRGDLRTMLSQSYDLERLAARVGTGRATPRDLVALARTLGTAAEGQGPAHRAGREAAQSARGGTGALPGDPRRDRRRAGRRPAPGDQGRRPDPRRLSCRASTSCGPMPAAASRGSPSSRPSRSARRGSPA